MEFDDTQALRALTAAGQLPQLLILSRDSSLIHVVRKAVPSGMPVSDAADLDDLADGMARVDPGVLVIDAAGTADLPATLIQLTQHFPEMVVIVVGQREDSAALMRLTAEGRVFRFLLSPVSHGQARLAIKAAAAQHIDLKAASTRRTVIEAPLPRSFNVAYAALAAVLLIVIAGVWFTVAHMTSEPQPAAVAQSQEAVKVPHALPERIDPVVGELALAAEAFDAGHYIEPRGESALDFYRSALAMDPGNTEAAAGVHAVVGKILERAEAALTAERLGEAARVMEIARDIDPNHSRLAFLDVQVARERERLALTQARGVDQRVRSLLARADTHLRAGRLIAPAAENASTVLLEARRIDPTDPSVARSIRELSAQFAEMAQAALASGSSAEARIYVAAARQLGSNAAALANVERQLADTQRRATVRPAAVAAVTPALASQQTSISAAEKVEAPLVAEPQRAPPSVPPQADPSSAQVSMTSSEPIEAFSLPRRREVLPKYPHQAFKARTEGWVFLEFTISSEGVPQNLVVRESQPSRTFDRAAIEAVRQWRFVPIMRDGVAVDQRAKLRVTFRPS